MNVYSGDGFEVKSKIITWSLSLSLSVLSPKLTAQYVTSATRGLAIKTEDVSSIRSSSNHSSLLNKHHCRSHGQKMITNAVKLSIFVQLPSSVQRFHWLGFIKSPKWLCSSRLDHKAGSWTAQWLTSALSYLLFQRYLVIINDIINPPVNLYAVHCLRSHQSCSMMQISWKSSA